MKTISAAEANRHFSEVLREATRGQTILITSRGKPVATLGPASGRLQVRAAARDALLARLSKRKGGGARNWERADLYDDER
ncbi:type II toxin-antitoxin system prevent-host-death family antitoxin [Steroidobacter sp. S1-65]|uniref:Antitoxin n=1 Tax=Steroidobacter gossypii TaxID=2805490 RepID=A0ABS1X0D4_9GAMM|nr:type II toxin-antitoxin system prevent-host-death family antitoxin [Steroidobacter gossypii]MBM0106664.1 type II toxin-antitoxin system prevent-host-death family antitoxin [Steroidobacter gossypii]